MSDAPQATDAPVPVGVRTFIVAGLPVLAAGVPDRGAGRDLLAAVEAGGLVLLPGVKDVELRRGAALGFVVDAAQLRLVDPDDATLLRAPREGLDDGWLAAAKRLRGTMTLVARDLDIDATIAPEVLMGHLDAAAQEGCVLGAIVGVVEERPTLPLVLT